MLRLLIVLQRPTGGLVDAFGPGFGVARQLFLGDGRIEAGLGGDEVRMALGVFVGVDGEQGLAGGDPVARLDHDLDDPPGEGREDGDGARIVRGDLAVGDGDVAEVMGVGRRHGQVGALSLGEDDNAGRRCRIGGLGGRAMMEGGDRDQHRRGCSTATQAEPLPGRAPAFENLAPGPGHETVPLSTLHAASLRGIS